jgi:hypothetical protein
MRTRNAMKARLQVEPLEGRFALSTISPAVHATADVTPLSQATTTVFHLKGAETYASGYLRDPSTGNTTFLYVDAFSQVTQNRGTPQTSVNAFAYFETYDAGGNFLYYGSATADSGSVSLKSTKNLASDTFSATFTNVPTSNGSSATLAVNGLTFTGTGDISKYHNVSQQSYPGFHAVYNTLSDYRNATITDGSVSLNDAPLSGLGNMYASIDSVSEGTVTITH